MLAATRIGSVVNLQMWTPFLSPPSSFFWAPWSISLRQPLSVSLLFFLSWFFVCLFVCLLACFLGLGVESELQLLAYATATATWDLSHRCDLCLSLQQCWIFNPLRPGIEPAYSWTLVRFLTCWTTAGTPSSFSDEALSMDDKPMFSFTVAHFSHILFTYLCSPELTWVLESL